MCGQMKNCSTIGPYSIKDIPVFKIDYRGITEYARSRGVSVVSLSDEEKNRFISGASMNDVRKAQLR